MLPSLLNIMHFNNINGDEWRDLMELNFDVKTVFKYNIVERNMWPLFNYYRSRSYLEYSIFEECHPLV